MEGQEHILIIGHRSCRGDVFEIRDEWDIVVEEFIVAIEENALGDDIRRVWVRNERHN